MKAYVVGGAVRDRLLGAEVHDRDWVVVGATPEELLAAGYTPVGRDFPVFLHPTTHEQYALARTERKARPGYQGFVFHAAPDVTLLQDLARRDLTINAIAEDPDTGELIDPFGGQIDLHDRVLRHVSDAFAEDPVRLLRVARFAARWPHFTVADATLALLRRLVDGGEVDALVPERVWQELSRGLSEVQPSRMFDVLRDSGALARLAPALDAWCSDAVRRLPLMKAIDTLPASPAPLRFAGLCHGLDAGDHSGTLPQLHALCQRWGVDAERRELAVIVAHEWPTMHAADAFDAEACMALLDRCDAWRRPQRLGLALATFEGLAGMLSEAARETLHQRCSGLRVALMAAQSVTTASLSSVVRQASGPALGQALRQARLQAIAQAFARP